VILNVFDPERMVEPPYSGLEAIRMIDQHSRSLANAGHRAAAELDRLGVPNRVIFVPGKAAQIIVDVANQEAVHLLVMGGENKGRLRSFLEGNLWSDVSRMASCNVMRVDPNSPLDTRILPQPREIKQLTSTAFSVTEAAG
jgi:nucleotide-binding universal stress UspA family protein